MKGYVVNFCCNNGVGFIQNLLMGEILSHSMSRKTIEGNDEMTDLERKVVVPRVNEMNDEDKCSIKEFLDSF